VPSPGQSLVLGGLDVVAQIRRGTVAQAAAATGAKVIELQSFARSAQGHQGSAQPLTVSALPQGIDSPRSQKPSTSRPSKEPKASSSYASALGRATLAAATDRQWGLATALLEELRLAPEEQCREALAQSDPTRKTALRMCVDGLLKERPPLLAGLEGGLFVALLGARRPYWWTFKIKMVNWRTLWICGEIMIGLPKSKMELSKASRPWTALLPSWETEWENCRWSNAEEHFGQLFEPSSEDQDQVYRMTVDDGADTELRLCFVEPGATASLGHSALRNALGIPLLAGTGKIAGMPASGVFSPGTCARLAAEKTSTGPRETARTLMELGADTRALADDGLSPYTASILKQDPCSILKGLNPGLRLRILRGDANAWAEVARSASGEGYPDMAAGALSRGLIIPQVMAANLLAYCFQADLPLLAVRVLARVDGQRYLMAALERASERSWLRASETILQQWRPGQKKPHWLSPESLKYAISEIQKGHLQFRIILDSMRNYFRLTEAEGFCTDPCVLPLGKGGAECPICFEPLNKAAPVAFLDTDGCAICPHFLCTSCSRGFASTASSQGEAIRCPECRRHAASMGLLPSLLEDPLAWFEFLAGKSSSTMPQTLLLRALSALLPVDAESLETSFSENICSEPWGQEVSVTELITSGAYAWVWRHLREHERYAQLGQPPDLLDREEWFKFWNLAKDGKLSRGEMLRAILRSFGVGSLEKERLNVVMDKMDRLWDIRSLQRTPSGHQNPDFISCEEFAADGGFGDLLQEEFSLEPGGQGLHPVAPETGAAAQVRKLLQGRLHSKPGGRPRYGQGWHDRSGQPRPEQAPRNAWEEPPPPDLMVPSETSAVIGSLGVPDVSPPPSMPATITHSRSLQSDDYISSAGSGDYDTMSNASMVSHSVAAHDVISRLSLSRSSWSTVDMERGSRQAETSLDAEASPPEPLVRPLPRKASIISL